MKASNQQSFEAISRGFSSMTTDDITTSVITWVKPSSSRKRRIRTQNQSVGKSLVDDLRTSRTSSSINRVSSKLPNLLSNGNFHSTTIEHLPYRSESQARQTMTASLSKFDRQTTSNHQTKRFPTVYSIVNPDDQKRIAEQRRRQIYALNHLMRELEQEQFRQYCKQHGINLTRQQDLIDNKSDATP